MNSKLNLNYNKTLEKNGVVFIDINLAYIEAGAKIGTGTIVYPMVFIDEKSLIGKNSKIYQGTELENAILENNVIIRANSRIAHSKIGNDTIVEQSVILESEIGKNTTVGPFAYIRPNTKVGDNCRIGDFVELKNSNIGNETKVSHLTYVGDSDLGEKINLGCGVVFVNYDGKEKYRTTVEDGAFIGCNANIISPKTIGKGSYIAAGSTVTKDVPKGALYIERETPKIVEGFAKTKLKKKELKEKE